MYFRIENRNQSCTKLEFNFVLFTEKKMNCGQNIAEGRMSACFFFELQKPFIKIRIAKSSYPGIVSRVFVNSEPGIATPFFQGIDHRCSFVHCGEITMNGKSGTCSTIFGRSCFLTESITEPRFPAPWRKRISGLSFFSLLYLNANSFNLIISFDFSMIKKFQKKLEGEIMKKLKWGLIGCGDISEKRVAPALRDLDNCDLVSINRANYAKAEAFARQFGARKWTKDWREIIEDDEIEAVYIATPVYLHAEMTIAAAKAGKHVLCEKPMGMNAGECDEMINACDSNGVKLGIAYYRHFYPAVSRIREIIKSGEIGIIAYAQINNFEPFNRRPGEPRYWLLQKDKSGGGPMMDMGCHRIEVLTTILGHIKEAKGFLSNVL